MSHRKHCMYEKTSIYQTWHNRLDILAQHYRSKTFHSAKFDLSIDNKMMWYIVYKYICVCIRYTMRKMQSCNQKIDYAQSAGTNKYYQHPTKLNIKQ